MWLMIDQSNTIGAAVPCSNAKGWSTIRTRRPLGNNVFQTPGAVGLLTGILLRGSIRKEYEHDTVTARDSVDAPNSVHVKTL
jgi:hypothetical protein